MTTTEQDPDTKVTDEEKGDDPASVPRRVPPGTPDPRIRPLDDKRIQIPR